ncbi:MAG TPA: hypothetical protein VEC12_05595, partial [Bacteroidia bacterium]|nr:hypothetical protein [Bacteroidia bacterium]
MKKLLFTTCGMVLCLGLFAQKWTSAYRFANVHQPIALESPALNVVVVATNVGILHSPDTGITWDTAMMISGIKEMQCKGNNCYAITEKQLLKSTDKGATWAILSAPMINSGTKNITMKVWSEDKVVLWIFFPNLKDSVFYTLDEGASWINGKTKYLGAPILIHTENTAFDLATFNPTVQVTQNKGNNYTGTSLETYRADYIIWNFLDSMVGYVSSVTDVAGDGAAFAVKIRKTTDGGKTWKGAPWTTSGLTIYEQIISYPPEPQIHNTHFINESTGWFSAYYGNDNKFMKTTDSGRTWVADTLGWKSLGMTITGTVDVSYIKHMKMHSASFGWALRRSTTTDTAVVLLKYGQPEFNPSTVKGRVYIDVNKNCQFDAGTDIPVKNKAVFTAENEFYDFTNQDGEYEITGLGAQNYTVNAGLVIDGIKTLSFLCSNPGSKMINITAG